MNLTSSASSQQQSRGALSADSPQVRESPKESLGVRFIGIARVFAFIENIGLEMCLCEPFHCNPHLHGSSWVQVCCWWPEFGQRFGGLATGPGLIPKECGDLLLGVSVSWKIMGYNESTGRI